MSYIPQIIFYTSFISAGLAFLYGLRLMKLKAINLLVLLVGISFIADLINAFISFYYIRYNIDLGLRSIGASYRILEFLILAIFVRFFQYNAAAKNLIFIISICIIAYFISIQPAFFKVTVDSTLIRISSAILVIIIGMLFYKSTITKMNIPHIEKWPVFYLVSALFIYFSGVLMALILQFPIMKIDRLIGNYLTTFHNTWLIVRNVLLIIGFYYTYKTKYKWSPISIL